MTMVDRRMLALLHEILERVGPDGEAGGHRRRIEALESGFTSEYSYEFAGLRPELPMTDSALVHDVLEMFSVFERAMQRLGDQADAEFGDRARGTLELAGFDFNHPREARLAEFAEHLTGDLLIWSPRHTVTCGAHQIDLGPIATRVSQLALANPDEPRAAAAVGPTATAHFRGAAAGSTITLELLPAGTTREAWLAGSPSTDPQPDTPSTGRPDRR